MESLRWILIAAGIVFIVAIYLLGKKRRHRDSSSADELEAAADADLEFDTDTEADLDMGLPEFSANSLDDVDEGVGAVRILSGGDSYGEESDYDEQSGLSENSSSERKSSFSESNSSPTDDLSEANKEANNGHYNNGPKDIIVIYILPKADEVLSGSQINSAAQALGLSFGEMNIFHYMRDGRSVFSLANMLEPGTFNSETIHDLKTSGLTLFMQINGDDPMDDLTEMLQRSYQLAGLLEARLCNHKRKPLTEQDAENYRAQISDFAVS